MTQSVLVIEQVIVNFIVSTDPKTLCTAPLEDDLEIVELISAIQSHLVHDFIVRKMLSSEPENKLIRNAGLKKRARDMAETEEYLLHAGVARKIMKELKVRVYYCLFEIIRFCFSYIPKIKSRLLNSACT